MNIIRLVVVILFISFCCSYSRAESHELETCEGHLSKYRRFLLQSILSFEDVCDAYNTRTTINGDNNLPPQIAFFGRYQPPEQKTEIWTFIKLIMGEFGDVDFANVVRDVVMDKCRTKLQQQQQGEQQRDNKRDTKVLGKKQRFHSWGGKRSSGLADINNELDQEDLNI